MTKPKNHYTKELNRDPEMYYDTLSRLMEIIPGTHGEKSAMAAGLEFRLRELGKLTATSSDRALLITEMTAREKLRQYASYITIIPDQDEWREIHGYECSFNYITALRHSITAELQQAAAEFQKHQKQTAQMHHECELQEWRQERRKLIRRLKWEKARKLLARLMPLCRLHKKPQMPRMIYLASEPGQTGSRKGEKRRALFAGSQPSADSNGWDNVVRCYEESVRE